MKIGIVSDTHSNAQALKSVLKHMDSVGVDKKVHLGNIVGLCAEPNKTIELTVMNFNYIVAGDLDFDILDKDRLNWLTPSHKEIAEWTTISTREENKQFLRNLEHGYLVNKSIALVNSHSDDHIDGDILFCGSLYTVGETKHPYIYQFGGERIVPKMLSRVGESEITYSLEKGKQYMIVVGSCGFPTGGDNRASYAIYDTEENEVTFYRIPYNIDKTVGSMQREGFPQKIINKVLYGV